MTNRRTDRVEEVKRLSLGLSKSGVWWLHFAVTQAGAPQACPNGILGYASVECGRKSGWSSGGDSWRAGAARAGTADGASRVPRSARVPLQGNDRPGLGCL